MSAIELIYIYIYILYIYIYIYIYLYKYIYREIININKPLLVNVLFYKLWQMSS